MLAMWSAATGVVCARWTGATIEEQSVEQTCLEGACTWALQALIESTR
jgi:hypothetical protein